MNVVPGLTIQRLTRRWSALRSSLNFNKEDLRDADFEGADLQGAMFLNAELHGANLSYADLRLAQLGGADLRQANLRGARLRGAYLLDAIYDRDTQWPDDFNPAAHGAVFVPVY